MARERHVINGRAALIILESGSSSLINRPDREFKKKETGSKDNAMARALSDSISLSCFELSFIKLRDFVSLLSVFLRESVNLYKLVRREFFPR